VLPESRIGSTMEAHRQPPEDGTGGTASHRKIRPRSCRRPASPGLSQRQAPGNGNRRPSVNPGGRHCRSETIVRGRRIADQSDCFRDPRPRPEKIRTGVRPVLAVVRRADGA
jgi:hypothetical protein